MNYGVSIQCVQGRLVVYSKYVNVKKKKNSFFMKLTKVFHFSFYLFIFLQCFIIAQNILDEAMIMYIVLIYDDKIFYGKKIITLTKCPKS